MNTLEITFSKIILRISDPLYRNAVKRISGKVTEKGLGVFEFPLSTHNLKRIADFFPPEQKPRVVKGQSILDNLKSRLANYKSWRAAVQEVLERKDYPVEPNGKFVPYKHQRMIIGVINSNNFAPILADCGVGKTGSLARAVELQLKNGKTKKGKILVSAPLSILDTSWCDDIRRFTNLKVGVLWTSKGNKDILGEKVEIARFAEKPACITTKTKKAVRFRHNAAGDIRDKLTALDRPGDYTKYQAEWKVAVTLDGFEQPFGAMIGRKLDKDETRERYIRETLAGDYDLFLINHDGVRIYEEILREHGFDWVIVDESTKIKNPKAQIWQSHVAISWKCSRRNILSGTPNPNGFDDLWAQFYFLDRGMTLEPAMKDFLFEYFRPEVLGYIATAAGKKAAVDYVIRDESAQAALISRVRSVGICLEQRDCIDLPPRTDMRRVAFMTPEQERAYMEMATTLVARLENTTTGKMVEAEAVNVLVKIMKLRQITSGFLVNKEGEEVEVANNPKTSELEDFVGELGGKKVVVVAQFTKEIDLLVKRFGAKKIDGSVAAERRKGIIDEFQNDPKHGMIILQPAAAAHGITLTAASHMVLMSLDYNFEYYYQVIKRIERIGQKSPMFITHMVARFADGEPTIDEDLMAILNDKSEDRAALFGSAQMPVAQVAQRLMQHISQQVRERK